MARECRGGEQRTTHNEVSRRETRCFQFVAVWFGADGATYELLAMFLLNLTSFTRPLRNKHFPPPSDCEIPPRSRQMHSNWHGIIIVCTNFDSERGAMNDRRLCRVELSKSEFAKKSRVDSRHSSPFACEGHSKWNSLVSGNKTCGWYCLSPVASGQAI